MTGTSTSCSRFSRPAGLTLIEVVAAIAILGTILVGVVLAKARHTRQLALTARREVAVRLADELLSQWWTGGDGVPVGVSGEDANASLAWRTRRVPNPPIERLGARVVRLEVRDILGGPEAEGLDDADRMLVDVDLVLPPAPQDPNEAPPPAGGQSGRGVRP